MEYKKTVSSILELSWSSLSSKDLQALMILSAYAAKEFAESLRLTLELFPNESLLKEMAVGELQTDNLVFEEYNQIGDHADFLWYFIKKYDLLSRVDQNVMESGKDYVEKIKKMDEAIRAMSIFSREEELPHIFENILSAESWEAEGLGAFQYYLKRHIQLDSEEGGHADLVSDMEVDDRVNDFYQKRLDMYKCIPKLFIVEN